MGEFTDYTELSTLDANALFAVLDSGVTRTIDYTNLRAQMFDAAAVFNETGAAVDFRVESDTQTHMLFVDGTNNRVGIGTNTPSHELEVANASSPTIAINDTGGTALAVSAWIEGQYAGTSAWDVGMNTTSGSFLLRNFLAGNMLFTVQTGQEFVFNESGDSVDFRVEGDTNANMLFVDGSADRVGIGTSTPDVVLDIEHPSNATVYINDGTGTITNCLARIIGQYSGTNAWTIGMQDSDTLVLNNNIFGGDTFFVTSGVSRLLIDGSGNVTINDSGASVDFRVEGDTNANMLFVDASADRVGIGTNAPLTELQIDGTSGTRLAPTLTLYSGFNGSGAAGDLFGKIDFYSADTSTPGAGTRASIYAEAQDAFGARTDFVFTTLFGGANTEFMRVKGTAGSEAVVFNDTGTDLNFRIESTGNTDMMFVDAGNDRVGIGTNAPAYTLDVNGNINFTQSIQTYTPDLFGGTVTGSPTYSQRQGVYWDVGNLRFFITEVTITALNTTAGVLYVTLPSTIAPSASYATQSVTIGIMSGVTSPETYWAVAYDNTNDVFFWDGTGSQLAHTDVTGTLTIKISGWYATA